MTILQINYGVFAVQSNRKAAKTIDISSVIAAYEPHRFSRANRAMLRELARTEAAIQAVQARIDALQARDSAARPMRT